MAGIIALTPATPDSHAAILARFYGLPFAHLSESTLRSPALARHPKHDIVRVMLDLHRDFPGIRLGSRPEILRHWADRAGVECDVLREAIRFIELRARHFPSESHALADWWRQAKGKA